MFIKFCELSGIKMKLETGENPIKSSQSMTCLLAQQSYGGSEEFARFRIDRPYNSVKKKHFKESSDSWHPKSLEHNRSISTCSLQSNVTNTCYTGTDYFWGVTLQTSYNFIMDTDLMDSCNAVQQNTSGNRKYVQEIVVLPDVGKTVDKITVKELGLSGNSSKLRKWLIDMEERIWKIPSLKESMKIKPAELEKCLSEHSELYKEIIGHGSIVRASIRPNSSRNQLETTYLEGLERKYHLLYLKAIEVKIILEGLTEQNYTSSNESSDEEPETKTIRLGEFKNEFKFSEISYEYDDGFEADCESSDCERIDRKSPPPLAPLSPPILNDCDYDGLSDVLSESTSSINFIDDSNFNRSNRKSKNCGIFYFKHQESDVEIERISSSSDDWISKEDDILEGISVLNDEEYHEKVSTKESIKLLILGAESLICDKMPTNRTDFLVSSPESETTFQQKNSRVEEWLQSQPNFYESSLDNSEGLGDSIETSGSDLENQPKIQSNLERCLSPITITSINSLAQFSVSDSALNTADSGYYDRSALIKVQLFPEKLKPLVKLDDDESEFDDLNSCSEQEWDDYQEEKYTTGSYSEEIDTDAFMKLLDFGDNYRNFLDSQSDFSSSSLSDFEEEEINPTPESSMMNQATLAFEENVHKSDSSSSNSFTTRSTKKVTDSIQDSNQDSIKDSIQDSIHHSLLPKDFDDIIATCRENPHCLRAVLQSQPGAILSPHKCREITLRECRCAKITRFMARVFNFLMDITNLIKNWRLYRFLTNTLNTFYKIAENVSLGIVTCTRYLSN